MGPQICLFAGFWKRGKQLYKWQGQSSDIDFDFSHPSIFFNGNATQIFYLIVRNTNTIFGKYGRYTSPSLSRQSSVTQTPWKKQDIGKLCCCKDGQHHQQEEGAGGAAWRARFEEESLEGRLWCPQEDQIGPGGDVELLRQSGRHRCCFWLQQDGCRECSCGWSFSWGSLLFALALLPRGESVKKIVSCNQHPSMTTATTSRLYCRSLTISSRSLLPSSTST